MKKLLLLPFVALLLAATYGPPFSVSDFSSLTNRPNPSAINPVGVVLGRTSAYDGAGGLFVFNPAATNAIDDDIYLGTTTTGRWVRISRLVLLADNPLTLTNGQLSSALLTNYFSFLAGTNMQVTVTSNTVTYAMTNTATGSGGTNWYAYVVNTSQLIEKFGLIGNDSSDSYGELRWNVAATTNLLGGTNIFASIVDHKITNIKLDYTPTNSLLGSDLSTTAGSFANVGPIYVGANLLLSESGGVNTLSAIVSSGTNSWQIGVDGVVVTTPNLADASNVSVTASGTNVTFNLTATGVSAGTYSNATFTVDDRGRLSSASSSDLYSTLTNILAGGTNVVLTYGANLITINSSATGSGGGGAGTNAFINGVLVQPLRMTNSASVLIYTNGSGDITFNVNDYDGFYSDLTNALVAGSNISFVYTNNTIRISSTSGSGSTNGTVVTVDGGADLTRANFADTTGINVANSGTNVTVNIIDRDFGDLTTSSSGTVMTIDNSVITSNKLAAANVTQDKLSASGTGTSTNFLAGDYTYKQVTTNMIPGLVSDIISLQKSLTFTNGVTNVNNVVSANLAEGSNISFSTNNGRITIASSGGGSFTISTNNLGFLSRSAAIVTNTETGGEVTHATFAIPANTLGVDGDEVEMHVAGQWLPYTSGGPNGYIYRLLYDDDSFAQLITGTLGTNIFPASSSTLSPDWLFRIKRVDSNTVFLSSVHSVGNQYNESNPTNLVNDTRVRYLDLQGSDTLDNATVTLSFTTEMVDGTRAATMKTYGYIMSKVGSGGGNGNAWDGSPIASGTITNLTVETINGGTITPNVQVFTTGTNTWTKPTGKTMAYVIAFGGGGGGGSGRRGAAGSIRSGGAGGASGAMSDNTFLLSDLASTETVIVGSGGTGGAEQTSNDSNGSTGGTGGSTTFGNWLWAGGGSGGGGGDADGVSSPGGGTGRWPGTAGGSSSATGAAGSSGAQAVSSITGSGGGGGGGISSGDSVSNGGAGGEGPRMWRGVSQMTGGSAGTSGGNGSNGNTAGTSVRIGGSGAGGGASSITTVAGSGGVGGLYGAGGGGGGASLNGNNSGAGGNGGNGVVIVISY